MDWPGDYINKVVCGDCLEVMKGIPDGSIDAVVTDPPYGIKFMGKSWDHGVPGSPFWREALRVAKPGAHLLAFGGTRTFHRLMVAIEDAGWELRDTIMWVYSQGFPKGQDVAWIMHKMACTSCGNMVYYSHEETKSIPGTDADTADIATGEKPHPKYNMRFVRATYLQTPVYACAECGQVLQPFVSEQESQELRATWSKSKTIWPEQSSVDRGSDLFPQARELQGCQICKMSHGILADGAEGWVHHGTSVGDGSIPWQIPNADGSCPSYRPQSLEQFHKQPHAFLLERTAQTRRGWNVALKPAWEPIVVARKPLEGTVAANVLKYGTGAMNIEGCRIGTEGGETHGGGWQDVMVGGTVANGGVIDNLTLRGRWPANLIHDGSEEVVGLMPNVKSGVAVRHRCGGNTFGGNNPKPPMDDMTYGDSGSAARFFKCCAPDEIELLFNRAMSILSAWNLLKGEGPCSQEIASSVVSSSCLSRQAAVFVLNDAVIAVSLGELRLNGVMELSTTVTENELNRLLTSITTAILSIGSDALRGQQPGKPIPNGCLVNIAKTQEPTDTTMITISHWKSDGSADVATFDIMQHNLVHGEADSASRFKYCAKASKADRDEGLEGREARARPTMGSGIGGQPDQQRANNYNTHPTVKPTALMRYLCRLVTPPDGLILDPFCGSGSTGKAAIREGFRFIGVDSDTEAVTIAQKRIDAELAQTRLDFTTEVSP